MVTSVARCSEPRPTLFIDIRWMTSPVVRGFLAQLFIHSFITICKAHYVENVESEALQAVARWYLVGMTSYHIGPYGTSSDQTGSDLYS